MTERTEPSEAELRQEYAAAFAQILHEAIDLGVALAKFDIARRRLGAATTALRALGLTDKEIHNP